MDKVEQSWRRIVDGLRDGDDLAVEELINRYGPSVERLAERHLAKGLRRRVGSDDVLQSVCRTFVRRAQDGQFEITDGGSLWGLLCAITLTKIREQSRFHLREKRGVHREEHLDSIMADGRPRVPELQTSDLPPDEAVDLEDQFEQLIGSLDEDEGQLVRLKLQDYTHEEIAERMGCSERTVRRILKRVQAHLNRRLEES